MNRTITTVAAAVAAVLSGGAAMAQPSLSQIQAVQTGSGGTTINIMGSSAIKAALLSSIQNNFCGGTFTNITSSGSNTNFLGVSCVPASGKSSHDGSVYNVFIRYEGGSVSGYLPIVNGVGVNEISGPALTSLTPAINGASTGNGTDDSFTGPLVKVLPDLGIGDVEPKALINNNYPTAYVQSAWGPANGPGMFALTSSPLVDEVYALFVNQSSGFTNGSAPLNLSTQTVANILNHKVTNWSQVVDITGTPVSSGENITIVNREAGSGSRAATDILIAGDACSSAGSTSTIFHGYATQYFSTGDVLTAASGIPGSITYATIDNSKTNMVPVNLNGVTPSNLNAALGTYPFWVEAQYINNSANTGADPVAINNIVAALQAQGTTAALADINVIPNVAAANSASTGVAHFNTTIHANPNGNGLVPTGGGTATVYVNPYTRGGVTCAYPVDFANTIP
jgi:ABC-type phosphate transport system substrate-binding protein